MNFFSVSGDIKVDNDLFLLAQPIWVYADSGTRRI